MIDFVGGALIFTEIVNKISTCEPAKNKSTEDLYKQYDSCCETKGVKVSFSTTELILKEPVESWIQPKRKTYYN